ncbi:MAG: hypothetical protein JXR53_03345 [Bacteroidales bacterium]|nr:hypothetical protein [Bacteroidales bacterium]
MKKKGWRMTPSTDYHYIIFELESGEIIIMTSLLYRNAKDVLKYFSDKIVYYRHPAMYSWINDKYNIYI